MLLLFAATPVERALDYLTGEVPRWKAENGCYSCHNNGDAARALMAGGRGAAIADTLAWLSNPDAWDKEQADAAFRDKDLARVQFAFALSEAVERGLVKDRAALARAAASLPAVKEDSEIGSPATYGQALALAARIRVLRAAGLTATAQEAALRAMKARNTPEHAAQVLALRVPPAPLLALQNPDGGWGPYRYAPSEVFDTALAILALLEAGAAPAGVVPRAVAWMEKQQLENGGWPATTRPSGGVSYAQHISTTGWATLALLKAGR
ncbi:MAG: hypothetical protein JNK87_41310 [Bryobacterales bacterium]|nr:hypothetical protein [Bryobacterales bacterium]